MNYTDDNGNPITLDKLCRIEPAWAANRIRAEIARAERAERLSACGGRVVEQCIGCGACADEAEQQPHRRCESAQDGCHHFVDRVLPWDEEEKQDCTNKCSNPGRCSECEDPARHLTAISQLLSDEWEAEQLPEWKQIPGAVRALIEERDDWRHAVAELSAEVKSLDKGGAGMIAAERRRQVEVEGWTPEHGDEHGDRQMAAAAVAYIRYGDEPRFAESPPGCFPWDLQWWKPAPYVRSLVKAGALIAAEIDRHMRAYPE